MKAWQVTVMVRPLGTLDAWERRAFRVFAETFEGAKNFAKLQAMRDNLETHFATHVIPE